jgi:hypothetical protein
MSRKEFKKSVRMCIALEEEYWEYVKQLAIQMSAKEKRAITPTEILRSAIIERYPMPKEIDLETESLNTCKVG